MGFRLNVDLETEAGPTQEAYIRIDNYRFNKITSEVILTTTTWLNKEKSHAFNRTYLEENLKNAEGLVSADVLYYPTGGKKEVEVAIPIIYRAPVAVVEEIEFPIYEEQETVEEVPYVSFDENGDEITKYKDQINLVKVKVGTKKEIRNKINPEIITNLYEFAYKVVKNKLAELFPEDKIEKI